MHPIGQVGNYNPDPADFPEGVHDAPLEVPGKTFADYLHSHTAGQTGGVLKPVNPDKFILISAGNDGLFGTEDDVTNFKGAL